MRLTFAGTAGLPCPHEGCSGTLAPWDCGCAFGCDLCDAGLECTVCHAKYLSAPRKKHKKVPCPYCGVLKVGLRGHIREKHPEVTP